MVASYDGAFEQAKRAIRQAAEAAYGRRMWSRVYVSGPITRGNRSYNLYQALEIHKKLLAHGWAVLNPMLTMLHPDEPNITHDEWLESDLPWVAVSDCVLRLPGASVGGDRETTYAIKLGIPVYTPEDFPWERWELAGKVAEAAHYETDCNVEAA